jgi:soluble lytic murein transglycosylase-like protein
MPMILKGRPPRKLLTIWSDGTQRLAPGAAVLFILCLARPSMATPIAYVEEGGRLIYLNAEDPELRSAETRGGPAAGRRVIERRRRSLEDLQPYIDGLSRQYGIDPELVNAVIEVESAWNPRARSRKGALGLMQLLPSTGLRLGVRDPFDPWDNIAGGVRYLRFLLDRFSGDVRLALAGYNAGENIVAARGDIPPYPETQSYVKQVLARYGRLTLGGAQSAQIYERVEGGRVVFANY